ncbi:MAG: hypothetical protein ACYTGL_12015 [Planctomycetota bacterium]|jgi:hypothetical protein
MNRHILLTALLASLIPSTLSAQIDLQNDRRSSVELLPEECLAVVELPHPDRLLTTLTEHTVWKRIQEHPEYRKATANPGYSFAMGLLASIEARIGMTWREAYSTLLGGGVTVAFDPETEGVIVLVRSTDAAKLQATSATLIELGRKDAESKGNAPLKESNYRGIKVYGRNDGGFAVIGSWIVATNKAELGKKTLDTILDGSERSLRDNEQLAAARRSIDGEPTAWGWFDLGRFREAGLASGLEKNQTDNPLAELLAGGFLTNLRQTPYVTAALYITGESTRLQVASPHDPAWVEEFREYWFGPDSSGVAEAPLQSDSTVFSLSTYRQVSEMWLRSGDLFDEQMNDELAKADANLTTFFAGKDFGEDVLGSFSPHLQLIVNRQDFTDVLPKPAIRLPGFAMTGHLENAEESRPELRRTFQSFIGFLNVVGAMEGNPQFDQDIEIYRDEKIYTASFLPEPDEKESERARIHFNFSPTLAFAGDRFIIASTTQIAKELIDAAADENHPPQTTSNTTASLRTETLRQVLDDNREQLIAQNMISDGHTRDEAEQQIGILLEVLSLFRELSFDIRTTDGQLKAELAITTQEQAGAR